MSAFDQSKREEVKKSIEELFKRVDGSTNRDFTKSGIAAARDKEISRAEFTKLKWSDIENIIGRDIMRERFRDEDGDGDVDMEDVWLKLDTNQDSTLTPDEFVAECLNEAYCTRAEAMEAYDILRDQDDELPVSKLGDAIRAIGLNPSEVQVQEMANKYDTNADGVLDREEWGNIVSDMLKFEKDDRKTLIDKFNIVAKDSKDSSGQVAIPTAELVFTMTKLGSGLSESEVQSMVKVVDANGDGSVQFEEFVTMVQKLPTYAAGEKP